MTRRRIIVAVCVMLMVMTIGVNVGASSKVTIHRDEYGVPHIYAQDLEGLYYGYGYAVAQDRLFQLEMSKRAYYGQVSEIFGADYYPLDLAMRRDNLTAQELKTQVAKLDSKYRSILKAYADGINAWIDEALANRDQKLPYEFHQLGFLPKHWTIEDTTTPYLITLGWFMDLTNELTNAEFYNAMISKHGETAAKTYFDDMVWGNDPGAVTTILSGATQAIAPAFEENQLALLDREGLIASAKMYQAETDLTKRLLAGIGFDLPEKLKQDATKAFSYCTVVGPKKSRTGEALIMSGPQFGFWLPSQCYEVGLHAPGIDVVGTNLVGVIFIMFGHNGSAAFASTAGAGNIEDIFEEKLNPRNPKQYWFNGKWVNMQSRVEKIAVRGERIPREENVYVTVHGPVVAQVDKDGDGKYDVAYSKKLGCRDSYISGMQGFTELMLAETPQEFIKAGQRNSLSINFFYADKKGNIGFYHCGDYPQRTKKKGFDPRFPTPGTGEYEWIGKIPQSKHPQIINPSNGLIVNWNNKPNAEWGNDDLGGMFNWAGWSQDHRATSINNLLATLNKVGEADLERIIKDIAYLDKRTINIKAYLSRALENVTEPRLVEARNYLNRWDGLRVDLNNDGYYDAVGETIWSKWWGIVNESIFADDLGSYWTQLLDNYAGYSVFYRALEGPDASIPMNNDYFNGRRWEDIFVDSLRLALDRLANDFKTTDMRKWLTPKATMEMIPVLMVGAPSSFGKVGTIDYMDRGTQNHIVRLARSGPVGKNILPAGESGFIDKDGVPSVHMSDQLQMFADFVYKQMLFTRGDVLSHAESTQILIYRPKK